MDWHAHLIRHVIGPVWARWERSPYLRRYRQLKRSQFDPAEQIQSRQWNSAQAILAHAYETVPFYRRRFDAAGIKPSAIAGFADFERLPLLTKNDIRSHGDDLISSQYDRAKLFCKTTSGSTGVSLAIYVDDDSLQWKRACTIRCDEWSGWRFGENVARVWGNPDYLRHGWRGRLRNALLDRARYLDTLNMDQNALASFAQALLRKPPSLIFGHAHSVYLFAEYLHEKGIDGIRPKGIITSAMILHDWQRRRIEEIFACKVTNRYGCEEVSLIACECERHQGLHVNVDGVYVEVLRDGRPALPGEAGSVIVTDLTNRAMPIIRYQVGDVATVSDRQCPCGRHYPLLERIEGREADYVVTASGALISGISLTENFALQVPGIAQLQIVQDSVSRFVFRIVRGAAFGPETLEQIERLTRKRFGPEVSYECEFVERIPQEASGKYRFCISKVPNPFTARQEAVS